MKNILSRFFLILGIFLILYASFLFWKRINPWRLSFSNYKPVTTQNKTKLIPQRLKIKSLKIDLPIIPQQINKNVWETTENGVSYLKNTHYILYGHNWQNLLGNLTKAKPKMNIEIEFNDKSVKKFAVINTLEVSPNQNKIPYDEKNQILIIYTCTGFFDEKRFVVTAR